MPNADISQTACLPGNSSVYSCQFRHLGVFPPAPDGIGQNSAHSAGLATTAFETADFTRKISRVTGRTYARRVTGHYRNPSLNGRSDVPKVRPSALFSRQIGQTAITRRIFACVVEPAQFDMEPFARFGVIHTTRIIRGASKQCKKQKSSRWPLPVSHLLPPVVAPLVNRPLWAAQVALVQLSSPAGTLAQAPLSAQPQTLPIAKATLAPAEASSDLNTFARPHSGSGVERTKPRCSQSASGFLHVKSSRTNRDQGPGEKPGQDRGRD